MKFTSLALCAFSVLALTNVEAKPNIVFIFTDDQDYQLNSLDYMPNVQKHMVEKGTLFKNHYATISLCCPSRVSLLRGQYAHNTNITDVRPPYGGYDRFNKLKLGEDYLPLWLQKAGYNTNYIGKLMNQYSVNNYNNPTPRGFNYQDQLVDPYTYVYDTAVFSKNGETPVYYKDAYQTDIIHAKTKAALKRLENSEDPFFLWVAPMAPHAQFIIHSNGTLDTSPAVPAARHAHLFKDVKIPRNDNFNPFKQTKTASFWKNLDRLDEDMVEKFDEAYRDRLRSLQAVDEMVGSVFEQLEKQGQLDNTFVIYSSDNGYHLGQHRSFPGKTANIEEDINVPFIVRGPGVPEGKISDTVGTHHDLPSTFLALANAQVPSWVDGGVIPITKELKNHAKPASKESFAVEYWTDTALNEMYMPTKKDQNGANIYKTLRIIANDYNYMYTVWCTGEHELYDLKKDPYETKNLYDSKKDSQLVARLDALLVVLKSCKAESCRDPWRILHPDGKVKTLKDALDKKNNKHYTQFKPMVFKECLPYYNEDNELPQIGLHFLANTTQKKEKPVVIQKREEKQLNIPEKYHSLFKMVPQSALIAGREMPKDDFEDHAIPVSSELLKTPVDWSEYNFYSFGN